MLTDFFAFEVDMLEKVRNAFEKVILLMNTCAVLDMTDIERISPDAILMIWTGGEIGGLGTSDVLMGRVSPSGHLTDSIIRSLEDASASKYFGNLNSNAYGEDIYVGYRYYETFNKDAVLYPFGYGLSYTQFEIMANAFAMDDKPCIDIPKISTVPFSVSITVTVKNIGDYAGKEVIQSYVSLPQGKLGQPALQTWLDLPRQSFWSQGRARLWKYPQQEALTQAMMIRASRAILMLISMRLANTNSSLVTM